MKSGMCFAGSRRRVHLFAVHVDINFNANHVSSEHWQPLPHEVEYHRGCGGHRQNRRIARVNSHQWSTAPPYADVKREASAARVENSYAHRQTPVPWSLLKGICPPKYAMCVAAGSVPFLRRALGVPVPAAGRDECEGETRRLHQ